jgi:hypothetical protein
LQTAAGAYGFKVHGARKQGDHTHSERWVVYFEHNHEGVVWKRFFVVKRALGGELYTTIETRPMSYADVCIE